MSKNKYLMLYFRENGVDHKTIAYHKKHNPIIFLDDIINIVTDCQLIIVCFLIYPQEKILNDVKKEFEDTNYDCVGQLNHTLFFLNNAANINNSINYKYQLYGCLNEGIFENLLSKQQITTDIMKQMCPCIMRVVTGNEYDYVNEHFRLVQILPHSNGSFNRYYIMDLPGQYTKAVKRSNP